MYQCLRFEHSGIFNSLSVFDKDWDSCINACNLNVLEFLIHCMHLIKIGIHWLFINACDFNVLEFLIHCLHLINIGIYVLFINSRDFNVLAFLIYCLHLYRDETLNVSSTVIIPAISFYILKTTQKVYWKEYLKNVRNRYK